MEYDEVPAGRQHQWRGGLEFEKPVERILNIKRKEEKVLKRLCSLLLSMVIGIIVLSVSVLVRAEEVSEFPVGTYYQMGRYNGGPILWRCADNTDENGVLLVSDRILCFKAADVSDGIQPTGFWDCLCQTNTELQI